MQRFRVEIQPDPPSGSLVTGTKGPIEERMARDEEAEELACDGVLTQLLLRGSSGEKTARDALFALAHSEPRNLAHLRPSELRPEDRRSFFASASRLMRNIIVDTARARLAQRRGGGATELALSNQLQSSSGEESILEVHEALFVLEQVEPRLAQVVEMRYYGGYSEAEIAETLGLTERALQRDWNKARLLLKVALGHKK